MGRVEIIERLEKLAGPDREVDACIAKALGEPHGYHEEVHLESRSYTVIEEQAKRYTASLDAVVALVEKCCPADADADHEKSEIRLQFGDFGCNAVVSRDTFAVERSFYGNAPTPAIALLIALLRALSSQDEEER